MGACDDCPIGWIGGQTRTIKDTCQICPDGEETKYPGESICKGCVVGKSSRSGETCEDCPIGWVRGAKDPASTCIACIFGKSTNFETRAKVCTIVAANEDIGHPKLLSVVPVMLPLQSITTLSYNSSVNGSGVNHSKELILTFTMKPEELEHVNITHIFVQWASEISFPETLDILTRPKDYKDLKINIQELRELQKTSKSKLDKPIEFKYTLPGTYPAWVKPLHIQATYMLSSGGRSSRSPIRSSHRIKSRCYDADGKQSYLRTHPNDDTCLKPLNLIGESLGVKESNSIKCVECPLGGSCNTTEGTGNMYLWDIPHLQGWWRVPWAAKRGNLRDADDVLIEAPVIFAECPRKDACLGIGPGAYFNDSGWFNDVGRVDVERNWTCPAPHPASKCVLGTEGPLCSICSNDYVRVQGRCEKCAPIESRIWLSLCVIIPMILCMVWLRRNFERLSGAVLHKLSGAVHDKLLDLSRLGVIVINLSQIASSLDDNIDVPWPRNVLDFLELLEVMEIDLAAMTGATCDNSVDFRISFIVMSLCPVAIFVLALGKYFNGLLHINKELSKLRKQESAVARESELQDT